MVHSGYEPTSVDDSLGTVRGFLATARATLFGPRAPRDAGAGAGAGVGRGVAGGGEVEPAGLAAAKDEGLIELPVLNSPSAAKVGLGSGRRATG